MLGRCRKALGQHFAQEMFRSQIEVASPVFANLFEAREFFQHSRQRLNTALAEEGMGLYGAASHPNAAWLRQKPATLRITSNCSLTTGMWRGVACSTACMFTWAYRQVATASN